MSAGAVPARGGAWRWVVAWLAACHSHGTSPVSDGSAEIAVSSSASKVTLAEVPGPVDALATSRMAVFGVSRARGIVFRIVGGDRGGHAGAHVLSSSEHEPFAIVTRGEKPVWASRDGLFACEEDGTGRRPLQEGAAVRAMAVGPHGVFFVASAVLWRVEWPQSSRVIRVADDVPADALVAMERSVVWLETKAGKVWALDLFTGARTEVARDQREPHDLSLVGDGRSAFWHESDADRPPGRRARAFLVESGSWSMRALPGEYASSDQYLVRAGCIYGAATCKLATQFDWQRTDSGDGVAPIADDAARWYWMEAGSQAGLWRIVSADKGLCCH
jgi:hypothetical protein